MATRAELAAGPSQGKKNWSRAEQTKLATCAGSIQRLSRLVDDLLDGSRAHVNQGAIERERVDIDQLAREVGERFADMASEAGCDLMIRTEPKVSACCDGFRTEQILVNLISNAMRYGNKRPIVVRSRQVGPRVELMVTDSGMGIARGDQSKIFDRFVRGSQVGTAKSGLGIGLWTVRDLAQQMDGSVWVDSEPGAGSTFTVSLPASL